MSQAALAEDLLAQPLPEFFPETLRRACTGKRIRFDLPKSVRERMQVPEDITVSEWAERYRMVTAIDAQPGRWRQELVPHTKKLMDLIGLPWVREVWLCMVERAGKTQILLNAACRQIDRGIDSGNVFWLMPSEAEARKALGERIVPVLKASPRMARLLSRYADDTTRSLVRFKHGPRLIPAWANSPSSLSSFFGRLCIGDEVDKCTELTGNETDPITLLKKRGRDIDDSKFLFASTPAGKYIYKNTLACQQVYAYESRCPACGEFVVMDEEHFILPEGADVESIKHGRHTVTYACNACGVEWNEADRAAAYHAGRWRAIKGADIDRPVSIGALLPAWPLPNIPMSEIGAAIARAKSGDLAAKRDLAHGYGARDHEEEHKERQEDAILRLCDARPSGVPPTWTDALEISIDTQDNGFWYRIRAWQYRTLQSALVQAGYVESFDALDTLIYQSTYADAEGREHHIQAGIIDSAGHRTSDVYDWCRRPGSRVLAAKGAQGRKTQPVTVSKIDHYPGTNKAIPGGLRLYHIDTHFHKDALAQKLSIEPGDPGCFWLHSGFSAGQLTEMQRDPTLRPPHGLESYAKQMCAEYRDEQGWWQCASGKANHLWDCESNGMALVMYLGWQNRVSDRPDAKPVARQGLQPKTPDADAPGRGLPSWFFNR